MSEDPTRQPASSEKAFTSDQWKGAEPTHAVKPENANVYAAAASQHTAGGSAADVTLTDAAKSIKIEDFASLPKKPCVRDSLLTGITAGFVVGSSRAIWRGMWTGNSCSCQLQSLIDYSSTRPICSQLGRRHLRHWIRGHVPILPVQASSRKGRHDTRHGDYRSQASRAQAKRSPSGESERAAPSEEGRGG
jgi:hypothetical protein